MAPSKLTHRQPSRPKVDARPSAPARDPIVKVSANGPQQKWTGGPARQVKFVRALPGHSAAPTPGLKLCVGPPLTSENPSGVTLARKHCPPFLIRDNAFSVYACQCGDAASSAEALRINIYIPFAKVRAHAYLTCISFLILLLQNPRERELPLDICVKNTATVRETIGYILYQYTALDRQPPAKARHVQAHPLCAGAGFGIRAADGGGERRARRGSAGAGPDAAYLQV